MDPKAFIEKVNSRTAKVGIIGLGYVGLPLAIEFAKAGFKTAGFDVDLAKPRMIAEGRSYIKHIPSESLRNANLSATTDFDLLGDMDAIIVCVPTPLNRFCEPDLSYVLNSTREIAKQLRPGQLVALESTTYPGTTDEDMRPILEAGGLKAGVDFFLAFSPEREDPNNPSFSTATIPKVVGGYTPACMAAAGALYGAVIELAGEINTSMPYYVVERVSRALNERSRSIRGSRVLVMGVAYKKDVDDMRESPSLKLMELPMEAGVDVAYHDPHVPKLPKTRKYAFEMSSVGLDAKTLKGFDCVLIATNHTACDYTMVAEHAGLIVDTRNAMAGFSSDKIVKA